MKPSLYTHFVKVKNGIIGYNILKDIFVFLSENEYNNYLELITFDNLSDKEISENCKKLIEHGFFVDCSQDEYNFLLEEHQKSIENASTYDLTILPSLDCNLRCWYCFEKHIYGSHMTTAIEENIVSHVKYIFETNENLTHLSVELFGGEPLLYFEKELYPLLLRLKTYIENIGKHISFFFITNAVCIEEKHIPLFANLNASFQISVDGYKNKHDKVKFIPDSKEGTYDKVINIIYKLTEQIENVFINLRINYDDNTLLHIDGIIRDLLDVNRKKIQIHLERVWQTSGKVDSSNQVLKNIINLLIANDFNVSYMNFSRRSFSCKASKKQQAVISYDGKVYKCCGRDFTDTHAVGELQNNGQIKWDNEKAEKYLNIKTFDNTMCENCKFLPQCWGPCNQKQIENENLHGYCQLNLMELGLDDFICYRFNNEYKKMQRCID